MIIGSGPHAARLRRAGLRHDPTAYRAQFSLHNFEPIHKGIHEALTSRGYAVSHHKNRWSMSSAARGLTPPTTTYKHSSGATAVVHDTGDESLADTHGVSHKSGKAHVRVWGPKKNSDFVGSHGHEDIKGLHETLDKIHGTGAKHSDGAEVVRMMHGDHGAEHTPGYPLDLPKHLHPAHDVLMRHGYQHEGHGSGQHWYSHHSGGKATIGGGEPSTFHPSTGYVRHPNSRAMDNHLTKFHGTGAKHSVESEPARFAKGDITTNQHGGEWAKTTHKTPEGMSPKHHATLVKHGYRYHGFKPHQGRTATGPVSAHVYKHPQTGHMVKSQWGITHVMKKVPTGYRHQSTHSDHHGTDTLDSALTKLHGGKS